MGRRREELADFHQVEGVVDLGGGVAEGQGVPVAFGFLSQADEESDPGAVDEPGCGEIGDDGSAAGCGKGLRVEACRGERIEAGGEGQDCGPRGLGGRR